MYQAVKPARFEYHAPTTVDETLGLLRDLREEDAKILAGGQSHLGGRIRDSHLHPEAVLRAMRAGPG